MKNKSIILLSGGLDSVLSLAKTIQDYNVQLAITFNYGQKSFEAELKASKLVANYYSIAHQVIDLPWLAEVSKSSLNTSSNIPEIDVSDLDNISVSQKTCDLVWVPNRNGLFVNIAASIAESNDYTHIIIGANAEEGATFKDNSKDFINAINNEFKYSVNKPLTLIAPYIHCTKEEMVADAMVLNVPFNFIFSCYSQNDKHCGKCESCLRLKRALELNDRHDIINLLFD